MFRSANNVFNLRKYVRKFERRTKKKNKRKKERKKEKKEKKESRAVTNNEKKKEKDKEIKKTGRKNKKTVSWKILEPSPNLGPAGFLATYASNRSGLEFVLRKRCKFTFVWATRRTMGPKSIQLASNPSSIDFDSHSSSSTGAEIERN